MDHKSSVELVLTLSPDLCRRLDEWAVRNAIRSREMAVAGLLELVLAQQETIPSQRARAELLAGNQIDLMDDVTATTEERKTRKRRLTRGPSVFRGVRRDQSKDKE